ncbi:adenylate kinase [Candidatus Micrarchaeota archaeon CG11_big_fil_rev_8_21_14_0_20_47_5]|nr:MAG: hypothetical protein AUJ17_03865 [Candidatus Micrarchaeota archaeon CG1_02_47_40]PIN83093.1 MAG: adenylate kinase [Candidatus Micrarchaeota archaeon CG11_big_fil_rev_8_21_14_0_20_47_5]
MRILLTGVPGTGKTAIAAELAKNFGFERVEINAVARKAGLVGKGGVVRLKKLEWELKARIKNAKKKNLVVEGHLGCEMRLPLDVALVLRCDPKKLKVRLEKREYGKKKLQENLLSEALDYCAVMAEGNYGKVKEIDTGKRGLKETAKLLLKIAGGKKKGDGVDWGGWLERTLKV